MGSFGDWIKKAVSTAGVAHAKKKMPMVKEVIDNPENLKLEVYFEHDEIVVKVKKRTK